MKKIFLTQRLEKIGKHKELRNNLDVRFISFFQALGILPLILPNELNYTKLIFKTIKPDGIVLSPGGDALKKDNRHKQEKFLINYAKKNKIPLLGVCRGAQVLNIFFGGKIVKFKEHIKKRHKLIGDIITKKYTKTKSLCYHDYGINKNSLAKKLQILAYTNDGSIECFLHTKYKIMGMMWHPERNKKITKFDMEIIKNFF